MHEISSTSVASRPKAMDEETLDFARKIFQLVRAGDAENLEPLLEYGADPELHNDQGQTPLAGAAYKGDMQVVELLLDYGTDVEGAAPGGKTALMLAAMFNRTSIVEVLLARGANIQAQDANGLTALDAARIMGADETAVQLARLMQ